MVATRRQRQSKDAPLSPSPCMMKAPPKKRPRRKVAAAKNVPKFEASPKKKAAPATRTPARGRSKRGAATKSATKKAATPATRQAAIDVENSKEAINRGAAAAAAAATAATAVDEATKTFILQDFDSTVEERISRMRASGRDVCIQLKNCLNIQLLKIPKKIRKMSMTEMKEQHGGDVEMAITSQLQDVIDKVLPSAGGGAFDSLVTPRLGRSFVDATKLLTGTRMTTRSQTRAKITASRTAGEAPRQSLAQATANAARLLSFGGNVRHGMAELGATPHPDTAYVGGGSAGGSEPAAAGIMNLADPEKLKNLDQAGKEAAIAQLQQLMGMLQGS